MCRHRVLKPIRPSTGSSRVKRGHRREEKQQKGKQDSVLWRWVDPDLKRKARGGAKMAA